MSVAKLFLLALFAFFGVVVAWWFLPPAIQAEISKKIRPQSAKASEKQAERTGSAPVQTRVYRWRDASGQQHFSNSPPKDQKYDVLHYRNDANVVGSE